MAAGAVRPYNLLMLPAFAGEAVRPRNLLMLPVFAGELVMQTGVNLHKIILELPAAVRERRFIAFALDSNVRP